MSDHPSNVFPEPIEEFGDSHDRDHRHGLDGRGQLDNDHGDDGFWLRDLLTRPELTKAPTALFEGIAYEGRHTLLAGREKLGKSEVLGLMTARADLEGPIAYFGFEEALGDLVARMQRYGADPDRVYVVENIRRIDDIAAHIAKVEAGLVVIDSLSSLLKTQLGVTASENSDEWGTWVERLTRTAHATGAAIVTVHHANKTNDGYRGHSSIAAAADLLVEMHGKPSETVRTFSSIGRVRGASVPKLMWTATGYAMESDTEDSVIEVEVRHALSVTPGLSTNGVIDVLNRRRDLVRQVVNRMYTEGLVIDRNHNPNNRSWLNSDEGARFPETDVPG